MSTFISRGFGGRRRDREQYGDRLPPGQYAESGFPVLTAGPTPRIDPDDWRFRIEGMVEQEREWIAARPSARTRLRRRRSNAA